MTTRIRGSAVDVVEGDRGSLPAFVDREADIQELQQAWRRAVGGKRQVVLLAGEPGMGKTTLVERLAREVVGAGGRILWGTCPPDPSTPFAPVAEILARAAAIAPTDVVSRYGVLAHIAPGLGARTSHVPPAPSDRRELFHAAAGLIAELAVRTPILLVVDDLHRAHRSTVRLLQYVLSATQQVPMLVVGTYCDTSVDRAHAVSSLLADLSGDPDVTHKVLDGLPLESVRDILPNPAVVDTLWTRSEGNPLFLGELLRHVGTALPTVDPRTLPQSVDAGVARRLARMDAGTRQLLAVASIIGPEFSLDTVARTGEVPPDRLLAAADEAVAGEIIEPEGQPNHYRFVHDAVRSAVEHRVAANRGIHVHGRLAEEMEKSPSIDEDHLVQLAFHAAGASPVGGSVSAAAHAARAGDQALAQLAFDEAAEWYGVGLGLLVGHSRDAAELKCRLLVSLGDAHDRAGEQVRARHSFLEAVAIARTVQDPALISRAESALARSPWPVPVHKPILSKIPVGTQNQHPFLMPEPPPVKLLPMGELLATSSAPDAPPPKSVRRSAPQVAAEQEMRAAAHRAAAAAAAADAAAHPSKPAPALESQKPTKGKSRKPAATAAAPAPVVAPVPITPPRPRRRPAAPPVADVAPPAAMADPYTPDDLRELWADPEPTSTPMGWTEAPWDDDDHTPASRNTTGRLSALRARHSRPWGPEDLEERLKASEQIVAIAEATDDGDLAMEGYAWRIADRMEMGRLSQADEDIAAFSTLANAIGDPIYRRDAAAYAAMRAILEGRFDDARSALLDVRALAERAGDTKETPGGREQRYWMALEWGSDEAVADVEASLKALPVGRAWAAQVALLLARTRRYDEALEWLGTISEHLVSARPFDAEWMQMAACALEAGALVRDPRLAAILLPLIQPYADGVVVLTGGLMCLGSTARFAGLAAATCGDWELAERNFDLAVGVNRKLEAYPAMAHTQAEWGWALLAQGRRADNKRAESLLVQARDLADELDMRRLAADIRVRRGGR
ncbi:MAG: hypothetical protein QOG43_2419 [Actinomycetota bacterium]|jgi:DNA polymerase III delta prime subunit|nr:hypothetical protein [Actinomycetota bacterium]